MAWCIGDADIKHLSRNEASVDKEDDLHPILGDEALNEDDEDEDNSSGQGIGANWNLQKCLMWPILLQFLRTNAPYITLPIAAVVGVIGYNLEAILSDRYTPYNKKPVEDQRMDRQIDEEALNDPTNVQKLKYKENVFGKNVAPSLQGKN